MNQLVNRMAYLAGVLLAVLFVLTGLALLVHRGDADPYQALAEYAPYTPGNPVPADVTCRWMWEYAGEAGQMCVLENPPYCQHGYLIAYQRTIAYVRLYDCDFPAAYLVAHSGRYQRLVYYRRSLMLAWDDRSAQGRRLGWFTLMQPISSVGWWRGHS